MDTYKDMNYAVKRMALTYYEAYSRDMMPEMQKVIWMCKKSIRLNYSGFPEIQFFPAGVSLLDCLEAFISKLEECLFCMTMENRSYTRFSRIKPEDFIGFVQENVIANSYTYINEPDIWKQILWCLHSMRAMGQAFGCISLFQNDGAPIQSFFAHAIAIAGHAAMIIFTHFLPNEIRQVESFLIDLLVHKILPDQALVLVGLLPVFFHKDAKRFINTDQSIVKMAIFLRCHILLLQSSCCDRVMLHLEVKKQLAILSDMLAFLGTNLAHLPSPGFKLQYEEMLTNITKAACFILCLYEGDNTSQDYMGDIDLSGSIQNIVLLTYQVLRRSFQSNSCGTDGLGFVDFLLDNIKELLSHSEVATPIKNQFEALLKELMFLHPLLTDVVAEQSTDQYDRLKSLAIGKAYEIEYIVDCFMSKDVPSWCLTPWLSDLIEETDSVKADMIRIKDKVWAAPTYNIANAASHVSTSSSANEEMVGFEDVVQTLRNKLVQETPAKLDVISILGIAGQGKTTVAHKLLLSDELVASRFDIRAKYFVPDAAYRRRDFLAAILSAAVDKPTSAFSGVPEDALVDKLREFFLSTRYLILLDDVREPRELDYLGACFPDANNGSRIIITTREARVADYARVAVSSTHRLRFLSDKESWTLLQKKVLFLQNCPPHIRDFGLDVVKDCNGLPKRVISLGNHLAGMTKKEFEQLANRFSGLIPEFFDELVKIHKESMLPKRKTFIFSEKFHKGRMREAWSDFLQDIKGHTSPERDVILERPDSTRGLAGGIVGFEDVLQTLADQLVKGTPERDVISIVGMAGQGKTTLADEIFIDESVVCRFDFRAKCCVSQVYERRDLLVAILSYAVDKQTDLNEMPEDELADKLRRHLLHKRYLILIDDVWDARAWDDLNPCFPDDNNGSRIILTTRLVEVADYARSFSPPYHLRLMTREESWTLLQKKVFLRETCPPDLADVGQEIARKCGRLPLSIVLVAGVVSSMREKEQWKQVAENLGQHIHADSKHIIEFSYKDLPRYLKPCFLYFGAFLEDKEIQISKLMKLWVAEGLIVKQRERCLEDIAEDYLEDLIRRSMVMATKRRSFGKIKACRLHDALLDFCKEKAKEENFLLWIYRDRDENSTKMWSQMLVPRRISIYSNQHDLIERSPSCSSVHSVLFRKVGDDIFTSINSPVSFPFHSFKCLRVLDLEVVTVDSFPTELSHLRYLALRTVETSLPTSIADLRNLETLVVKGLGGELSLPHSLCKMTRMRHLHINDRASFDLHNMEIFLEDPLQLENLETFSSPAFSSCEDVERVLRKTPNLRKLRCIFSGSWGLSEEQSRECNQFPTLQSLSKLESLKVFCLHYPGRSPCESDFPSNLKKLTLSGFRFPWSEISGISTLPNLVILKLQSDAFCGDEWEVRDEQFSQLKLLKLENISFVRWIISEDAFSNLEQLVLHTCDSLVEIPCEFGYSCCLQSIEVKSCQESVANSAKEVEEIQNEMQNSDFKLFIY